MGSIKKPYLLQYIGAYQPGYPAYLIVEPLTDKSILTDDGVKCNFPIVATSSAWYKFPLFTVPEEILNAPAADYVITLKMDGDKPDIEKGRVTITSYKPIPKP